ncbi:MAG: hypothetical protein WBD31_04585, partial [Rubripirellula sp.]
MFEQADYFGERAKQEPVQERAKHRQARRGNTRAYEQPNGSGHTKDEQETCSKIKYGFESSS